MSLSGNNSKYLLPVIKFKLSNKNLNFRKLVTTTSEPDRFPNLKTFFDLIVDDTNACDFFFFFFLGLHPQHMEVPRLGVK